MTQTPATQFLRSLRLDACALADLLDRLDQDQGSRSEGEEFRYRIESLIVSMQQPGDGSTTAFQTASRSLGAERLCVIHGGYVHVGSKCVAQLVSIHGNTEEVTGKVAACHHIEGNAHELEIRFENAIDPGLYCAEATKLHVLLVEDDLTLVGLASAHLAALNARVDHAENGQRAVELANQEVYDLIFMDMEMPVMDGFEATAELRKQGYMGLIVAATGLDTPEDVKRCLEVGCDHHVPKPYGKDSFAKIIESANREPLFSALASDPDMVHFIKSFVDELPNKLAELKEAWTAEDLQKVELLARSLKGDAGSHGFGPISDAAAGLEKILRKGGEEGSAAGDALRELDSLCMLARAATQKSE